MRLAIEQSFASLPTYSFPGSYDPNKLGLGSLIMQNNGTGNENKWVGPMPIAVARPNEQSTAITTGFPWAMQWSSTKDWVFLAENSAATATRRIVMYEFDRAAGLFTWKGYITLNGAGTAVTIRGFRMTYDKHTVGTITSTGTAVTGTGTNWQTDGACVGNRIGFGSTDPTQITTWYEIAAIASNTGITLTTTAPTFASATPYVIEDLRCITSQTNATATNGGLWVAKGLRAEAFNATGTTVAMAGTADNVRAHYWLADATTSLNTVALGLALEDKTSLTSHTCWVPDTVANPVLYKYNLRAPLTLTAGKATNALLLKTGSGGTLTGTASQLNNGRLIVMNHGPGAGQKCIYFTTGTRVYRTIPTDSIAAASTTFIADNMVEAPPGGINSLQVFGNITSIEYAASIDSICVATNATNTLSKSYITKYKTDGSQMDRAFGVDTKQTDVAGADSTQTLVPSNSGANYAVWIENGMMYLSTVSPTIVLNRLYAVPMGADWEYADITNGVVITPKILTPSADKLQSVYTSAIQVLGGTTGKNLGTRTEAFRVKYRTTGIDDNSGGWTALDQTGDLSGVAGSTAIQLRYEFSTLGSMMVQPRIHGCCVTYDDISTLSNFQFSAGKSDAANKRFAWRLSTAFGSAIPPLKIRLFDAVTGGLLSTDSSNAPTGTWERSSDGATWTGWTTADKTNETTYLRFTPQSLADNINVRPVITLV